MRQKAFAVGVAVLTAVVVQPAWAVRLTDVDDALHGEGLEDVGSAALATAVTTDQPAESQVEEGSSGHSRKEGGRRSQDSAEDSLTQSNRTSANSTKSEKRGTMEKAEAKKAKDDSKQKAKQEAGGGSSAKHKAKKTSTEQKSDKTSKASEKSSKKKGDEEESDKQVDEEDADKKGDDEESDDKEADNGEPEEQQIPHTAGGNVGSPGGSGGDAVSQPSADMSAEVAEASHSASSAVRKKGGSQASRQAAAKTAAKNVKQQGGKESFGKGKSKKPLVLGPHSTDSKKAAMQRWRAVVASLADGCDTMLDVKGPLHAVNCRVAAGFIQAIDGQLGATAAAPAEQAAGDPAVAGGAGGDAAEVVAQQLAANGQQAQAAAGVAEATEGAANAQLSAVDEAEAEESVDDAAEQESDGQKEDKSAVADATEGDADAASTADGEAQTDVSVADSEDTASVEEEASAQPASEAPKKASLLEVGGNPKSKKSGKSASDSGTQAWFSSDKDAAYIADALQGVIVRLLYSQWWNSPTTLYGTVSDTPDVRFGANPVTLGDCSYGRYCIMNPGATGEPIENSLSETYARQWAFNQREDTVPGNYFFRVEFLIFKSWEAAALQWMNGLHSVLPPMASGLHLVQCSESMPKTWRHFAKAFNLKWNVQEVKSGNKLEQIPMVVILDQSDVLDKDGNLGDHFKELYAWLASDDLGPKRHIGVRADQVIYPVVSKFYESLATGPTIYFILDLAPVIQLDASALSIIRQHGGGIVTINMFPGLPTVDPNDGSYYMSDKEIVSQDIKSSPCCVKKSPLYTSLTVARPRGLHAFAHAPRELDLLHIYVALGLPMPLNRGDSLAPFDTGQKQGDRQMAERAQGEVALGSGSWALGQHMLVGSQTWALLLERYKELGVACEDSKDATKLHEPWPALKAAVCQEYTRIMSDLSDNQPSDNQIVTDGKVLQLFHMHRIAWRSMQRWMQIWAPVEADFDVDTWAEENVYAQHDESPEESSRKVLVTASGIGAVASMWSYLITHKPDYSPRQKEEVAIIGTYQQDSEGQHIESLAEFLENEKEDMQTDRGAMLVMQSMYMETPPLIGMLFPSGVRVVQFGNDEEKALLTTLKGMLSGSLEVAKSFSAIFVEPILYKPSSPQFDRGHTMRLHSCKRKKGSPLKKCPLVHDAHIGPGVTNIKAILDVLCSTKTDRTDPFFFMIDNTLVAAGGFPLTDILQGKKIPSWLHIVELQSWFKLHQRGEEISPAGAMVVHSGDTDRHEKLVQGLLWARTSGGWDLPDRSAQALRFNGLLTRDRVKDYYVQAAGGAHMLGQFLEQHFSGDVTCPDGQPPCPAKIVVLGNHSSVAPRLLVDQPFLYVHVGNEEEQMCFEESVTARLAAMTSASGIPITRHRSFAFDHVLNVERTEGYNLMRMTASIPEAAMKRLIAVVEGSKANLRCPYESAETFKVPDPPSSISKSKVEPVPPSSQSDGAGSAEDAGVKTEAKAAVGGLPMETPDGS
eukprot:TRINITY_DN6012_c0_g1_i1.p1 TRINITY_DN6012_c0_g1~~TRINITY_DN6012_c0_g1_i1.p1  ORF type:complete len:1494 (+),score=476.99 TRINITY_DN6012_c0_g1_i1:97-4578(+)